MGFYRDCAGTQLVQPQSVLGLNMTIGISSGFYRDTVGCHHTSRWPAWSIRMAHHLLNIFASMFRTMAYQIPKNHPNVGKWFEHGAYGLFWLPILFPLRNCHARRWQDVRLLLDGVALLTAGRCRLAGARIEMRTGSITWEPKYGGFLKWVYT